MGIISPKGTKIEGLDRKAVKSRELPTKKNRKAKHRRQNYDRQKASVMLDHLLFLKR
jgi:hypothetical protein